ncbi:MAG: chorismate mutase [Candidatus Latescibacteria bacterium]|nr:chorismate mutase [Candidatus Latescibacterota bacterium]
MEEIADWRDKIDEIDVQLVTLINERARCAIEIGKIKKQNNMEIFNPDREQQVFTNIFQHNTGPVSDNAFLKLFKQIITTCRNLEK